MRETPFEQIKEELRLKIPDDLLEKIPDKWEKIGNILIIVLDEKLTSFKELISENYSKILNCKTVLNDVGGITGEYRTPNVEILYGTNDTETIHKENGVIFKLDPQKVMFSSGNMDERIRIGKIPNSEEVVVDLFAGIGYFTLPIAVHSRPKKIIAVEKNPDAFNFLSQNIVLNKVSRIVEPIKGDNRKVAPKNVADRVILGYLGDTYQFLPIAIEALNNYTGVIHYNDKFPEDQVPEKPLNVVKIIAERYDRMCSLLDYKCVKTYAPGISHYVFDIEVGCK